MSAARQLEDRLRDCQARLAAHTVLAGRLGLTRAESVVLGALLSHELASAAAIGAALAEVFPAVASSPETLRVLIHRLRRKLAPRGLAVHTLLEEGYYLDDTAKAMLRALAGVNGDGVSRETPRAEGADGYAFDVDGEVAP